MCFFIVITGLTVVVLVIAGLIVMIPTARLLTVVVSVMAVGWLVVYQTPYPLGNKVIARWNSHPISRVCIWGAEQLRSGRVLNLGPLAQKTRDLPLRHITGVGTTEILWVQGAESKNRRL